MHSSHLALGSRQGLWQTSHSQMQALAACQCQATIICAGHATACRTHSCAKGHSCHTRAQEIAPCIALAVTAECLSLDQHRARPAQSLRERSTGTAAGPSRHFLPRKGVFRVVLYPPHGMPRAYGTHVTVCCWRFCCVTCRCSLGQRVCAGWWPSPWCMAGT